MDMKNCIPLRVIWDFEENRYRQAFGEDLVEDTDWAVWDPNCGWILLDELDE